MEIHKKQDRRSCFFYAAKAATLRKTLPQMLTNFMHSTQTLPQVFYYFLNFYARLLYLPANAAPSPAKDISAG